MIALALVAELLIRLPAVGDCKNEVADAGNFDPRYHRSTIGMTKSPTEIIEVDSQRIEELLDRAASNTLCEEDTELMRQIFTSYTQFFVMARDKDTTIARLRKMLFGAGSEKADKVIGEQEDAPQAEDPCGDEQDTTAEIMASDDQEGSQPSGHGRYGADDYPGAEQVPVAHPTLAVGDDCPDCGQGTLYEKTPSVLVRFVGRSPLGATVYRMQKLRCHLCGKIFTAPQPEEAGPEKYDHTAASMIALLKYGSGLPFNRLERLQGNCEIPLAASTQWGIVDAAASLIMPAYQELIRQAAQGEVLYNDDTTVKILELMGQRLEKSPPEDLDQQPDRTGLFTSGVVATRAGDRIALFFSGRQHAGENLSDVLQHRSGELAAPIHMCDGLSRNLPQELNTIVANCIAHGRRKFVDIYDHFPKECRRVIEAFKVVYHNDQVARQQGMTDEQRLSHHQSHSQRAMDDLQAWLEQQLGDKLVEPNSSLGEAINYLLRRWDSLTLFLRKAGAPLDNNLCERALKKSILHRKNSMFYKTRRGALVGDLYMSLIYSCELAGVNVLDYLNQLQLQAADVAAQPDRWLPWNYGENLTATQDAA